MTLNNLSRYPKYPCNNFLSKCLKVIYFFFNLPDVSKCWDEFNFVRTQGPEYPPIIFHSLIEEDSRFYLIYSQNLKIDFKPELVRVTKQGLLLQQVEINDLKFGLFSSELSVKLYDQLDVTLFCFYLTFITF